VVSFFLRTASGSTPSLSVDDSRWNNIASFGPSGTGGVKLYWFEPDWGYDPTTAGTITFSWSGASGTGAGAAVAIAYVVDAGTKQVYHATQANGTVNFNDFDCNNISTLQTEAFDSLYLLTVGSPASNAVDNTTAPTGWPDNTYGGTGSGWNSGSDLAVAAIDHAITASTGTNPSNWNFSTSGNVVVGSGISFYTSGEPPANDDISDAEVLSVCESSTSGTLYGSWMTLAENDAVYYIDGHTVWYTLTDRTGGWNFSLDKVSGSSLSWAVIDGVFEADVGETNATTILSNPVTPDSTNSDFSTRHYDETYTLNSNKQYWIHVETGNAEFCTFTLEWAATTGSCVDNTDPTAAVSTAVYVPNVFERINWW
jgi:hypothetical protein